MSIFKYHLQRTHTKSYTFLLEKLKYYIWNDVITNSISSVTSILANINIINDAQNPNADKKYSTSVWAGYSWDCVKFDSFGISTDSPDLDDETIKP